MSISSIGIQTVTPTTGTSQERPQQQSAANDNSSQAAGKNGSSSQTTGKHVDKHA